MTSWLSRNLCFSLIVRVAELHLATIGSSRGSRTYLSIPHGRDCGYFGAGLGAEDAVYLMYTRTKVTTPCAEIARSRRVARLMEDIEIGSTTLHSQSRRRLSCRRVPFKAPRSSSR